MLYLSLVFQYQALCLWLVKPAKVPTEQGNWCKVQGRSEKVNSLLLLFSSWKDFTAHGSIKSLPSPHIWASKTIKPKEQYMHFTVNAALHSYLVNLPKHITIGLQVIWLQQIKFIHLCFWLPRTFLDFASLLFLFKLNLSLAFSEREPVPQCKHRKLLKIQENPGKVFKNQTISAKLFQQRFLSYLTETYILSHFLLIVYWEGLSCIFEGSWGKCSWFS